MQGYKSAGRETSWKALIIQCRVTMVEIKGVAVDIVRCWVLNLF